jgi:predicted membrane channel-forming protein YqfA (hemolysin III family)
MRDRPYTSHSYLPRPRESKVQRLIRWNFWISLLAFVAMVGWAYVLLARTGAQIAPISLGPDPVRLDWTNPGGIEYVVGEILLAVFVYRKGGSAARGAAVLAGLMLMAGFLVLVGSVAPGESPNPLVTAVMLYAIAAHLLYAVAGSSERLR